MSDAPRRPTTALALLILILATLLTFGQVITFDFTSWDDYETIARNPKLNPPTAAALKDFWTRPQMDLYAPVTWTTWALMANVTHDPKTFHALNLILHVATVCCVFALLDRLIRDRLAVLLGALLFALHPVQVETVAWVSGTKDLLCGLFTAIALWQYVLFAQGDRNGTLTPGECARTIAIATAAFVLAMLSKPTAVVLPLMAATIDLLIIRRPAKKVAMLVLPWMVLAIPMMVVTKLAQPAAHAQESAPLWVRPLVAADALTFYLWKLIWPAKLTFDYGRTPELVIEKRWVYFTWLAPGAIALIAWIARRTLAPAALLFLIALLPVLGLIPFDFQAYSTVADHYLYLPMIAVALALGWVIASLPARGVRIAAIVVLMVLAIRSFAQSSSWRNSSALFENALKVNPRSFASYNSLAAAAAEQGDVPLAARLSRRAIDIRPTYAAAHLTHADAMRRLGDTAAAMDSYQTALKYEPDYAPALNNLAAMLAEQGQFDRAISFAQRGLAVDPDSIEGHLNLGRMYFQTRQLDLARREFQTVRRQDPQNQPARELLKELGPN